MFKIFLVEKGIPAALDGPPDCCDPELDDIQSILVEICRALAETESIEFVISGFGRPRWPVDVRTDLPVVLEQLPGMLAFLRLPTNNSFYLDLYEQGIEARLTFTRSDGLVAIDCTSRTKWTPNPNREVSSISELNLMFVEVAQAFIVKAKQVHPALTQHAWFQQWVHEVLMGGTLLDIQS
jgi:hypothetical protein